MTHITPAGPTTTHPATGSGHILADPQCSVQPQPQTPSQMPTQEGEEAPPTYTPHTLPPYRHHDPVVDSQNYAISLLMSNLRNHSYSLDEPRFPALPFIYPPLQSQARIRSPDQTQGETRPGQGEEEMEGYGDPIQSAAVRDYRDTQDPAQWGMRSARSAGRLRQRGRGAGGREGGGFWNWVLDWVVVDPNQGDEEARARYTAGIPFWVTPNGAI